MGVVGVGAWTASPDAAGGYGRIAAACAVDVGLLGGVGGHVCAPGAKVVERYLVSLAFLCKSF